MEPKPARRTRSNERLEVLGSGARNLVDPAAGIGVCRRGLDLGDKLHPLTITPQTRSHDEGSRTRAPGHRCRRPIHKRERTEKRNFDAVLRTLGDLVDRQDDNVTRRKLLCSREESALRRKHPNADARAKLLEERIHAWSAHRLGNDPKLSPER